jgi:hypothetical protein
MPKTTVILIGCINFFIKSVNFCSTYLIHHRLMHVLFRSNKNGLISELFAGIPPNTGLFQMIVVEVGVKTECKIYGCRST